jgi:hypothetical protein
VSPDASACARKAPAVPATPQPNRTRSLRIWRSPTFYIALAALLAAALVCAARLAADTLTGTVKDPSGAIVAGAKVSIEGASLSQPLALTSDANGKFSAPNLAPGSYTVRVT